VLLGAFRTHPVLATVATTGVIFAAAYLLWAIQRILFNPLDKKENEHISDLNARELLLLAPLVACIVWLGVYPAPVLRRMEASATPRGHPRRDAGRGGARRRRRADGRHARGPVDELRSLGTRQLTAALAPDLLLIVGALALMLWAAWRPDSVEHQRSVGIGAIAVVLATLAAVVFYWVPRRHGLPGRTDRRGQLPVRRGRRSSCSAPSRRSHSRWTTTRASGSAPASRTCSCCSPPPG
jgi:hypothetical protein